MPEPFKPFIEQLKEACNLSGARWAAWLQVSTNKNTNQALVKTTGRTSSRSGGKTSSSKANSRSVSVPGHTWQLSVSCYLSKKRQAILLDFLQKQDVASWLAGGLSSGRIRSRQMGVLARSLGCSRIYAFPRPQGQTLILVGGEELGKEAQRVFKMLSLQSISPDLSVQRAKSDREEVLLQKANINAEALYLIHQVVQKVVGLKDISEVAQMTAELIAQYFKYEISAVILSDETGKELVIEGVGGNFAHLMPRGYRYLSNQGITGQVFSSGTNYFINDVSLMPEYFSIPGWQAGSEMCVALREGERVFGLINVERAQKNSFTEQDLLMLESLAGLLSSVMMNARRYQELVRLYQELQDRIKAQQSAEMKLVHSARLAAVGEMAAGIAHEMNNPLTTILGFTELILDDLSKENVSSHYYEDLRLILREAERARTVVHRLLDFSRQTENVRIPISLNDLVMDILSLISHLMKTGGVQVQLDLNPDLPFVCVDPNQIEQVLLNLLHNAQQAMPDGGKLGLSTAWFTEDEKKYVMISVSDTGTGIQPEIRERIFEPFFTTRAPGSGTGLGLSVSYGIIASHGGTIEVESQVGEGSRFIVKLPLENDEDDA